MKNQIMNIKNIFCPLLAMAAMTITSCSNNNDDDAAAKVVNQIGKFQVSINVGPAQTRAISVGGNDGHTLYTNWDNGDEVQVVKNGTTTVAGTLTADVSAGNSAYATLTGTLMGTFAVGDELTLYYHSASLDYTGQKGTIADVSTSKSFLTATSTVQQIGQADGTVKDGSDKYLVMSNASYTAMQAYLDISFTDNDGQALAITQLDIWTSDGKLVKTAPLGGEKTYATETSRLTVTPDVATDHFFLALRDEAGASNTFYFKATTADCIYTYSQDMKLDNGKYYYAASPKAMTKIPVTSITLNKTTTTIYMTDRIALTETLIVTNMTPDNAPYTWSSLNTDVATVNASTGEVTAVTAGTAHIRATAKDGSGVYGECVVTVKKFGFSKHIWYEDATYVAPSNFISVPQAAAKAAADAEKTAISAFGYVCIYALEDGEYMWIDSHSRTGQNSSIHDIVTIDAFFPTWGENQGEVSACSVEHYNECVWYTIEPEP
jgi:uncharacterized protein YjdB